MIVYLGNAQTAQQAVATAGSIAVSTAPLWTTAAWAVPVIGAAVAAVTFGLSRIFRRGAQKRAATQIVDELEPLLKQNLEGYLSGPRTVESQRQALQNFDAAWQYLTSSRGCGNPDLGDAGRRCISERARGGRWDWWAAYRDPIANDTARSASQAILAQAQSAGWVVPAALAVVALVL